MFKKSQVTIFIILGIVLIIVFSFVFMIREKVRDASSEAEITQQDVYDIELSNGISLKCTLDHKFMCSNDKMYTLKEIINNDLEILCKDI